MPHYLATLADRHSPTDMMRFDPRFWVVNFPRPCMASVITLSAASMKVDCVFYNKADLVGLIWESEDKIDHPLLGYETLTDYTGTILKFDWAQTGLQNLDQFNSATLTIEGVDSLGAPKTWYVRLWNYAVGTVTNATVTLDFSNLDGGFFLPQDGERVNPVGITGMFFSLVPPGYDGTSTAQHAAPIQASVAISNISCTGGNSLLKLFNADIEAHEFRMATGYDDSYNITPERMLRNIHELGYRVFINHYVGMSHYFRLEASAGKWLASSAGGYLNVATAAWHTDFFTRVKALGYDIIISLSYELFNENVWEAWKQRDVNNNPALTGWEPPSTLLSPVAAAPMAYLQNVAVAFCNLASAATLAVHFQIGEPWWWVRFDTWIPCFYDAATTALYLAETGLPAPPIADMRGSKTAAQIAFLNWLGTKLGASTINLRNAVKAAHPTAKTYLLFYAPQVQGGFTPELYRANRPAAWNKPAFDVLQLEDYDFVTEGRVDDSAVAAETVTVTLGYPVNEQHYFSGFVLLKEDAPEFWQRIIDAAEVALRRNVPQVFFWALPQIMRDGFTVFQPLDVTMRAWTFSLDGHDFYVLHLGEATLVFDTTTREWCEWRSTDRPNWRLSDGINWQEVIVGGDDTTATLWKITADSNTDGDGAPIVSIVTGALAMRMRDSLPCNAIFVSGGASDNITAGVAGGTSGTGGNGSVVSLRLLTSDDNEESWTDHGAVKISREVTVNQEVSWRSLGLIRAPGRIFQLIDNGSMQRIDGMDME